VSGKSPLTPDATVQYEQSHLLDLINWIGKHTAGLMLPADDRSMLAVGCFDVAIEHQGAISVLFTHGLYGSAFALLRVLTESLTRGLWLLNSATDKEIEKFKRGKLEKQFGQLVQEIESNMGTPDGVLSGFKTIGWGSMNGFTHTGMHQVSRRHTAGKVEASYPNHELKNALGVAGALGLIAAGQLLAMSDRSDLLPEFDVILAKYAGKD
jgi:hypothetical protein